VKHSQNTSQKLETSTKQILNHCLIEEKRLTMMDESPYNIM